MIKTVYILNKELLWFILTLPLKHAYAKKWHLV